MCIYTSRYIICFLYIVIPEEQTVISYAFIIGVANLLSLRFLGCLLTVQPYTMVISNVISTKSATGI